MNDILTNLSWLYRSQDSMTEQIRASVNATELINLATQNLSLVELENLGSKWVFGGFESSKLKDLKILILSNANYDLILNPLVATGLRHGINLEIVRSAYNQVGNIVFSESDNILRDVDIILLALDFRGLPFSINANENNLNEKVVPYIKSLLLGIREKTDAKLIVSNIAEPFVGLSGNKEISLKTSMLFQIDQFNKYLAELSSDDFYLLDVRYLANCVGTLNWFDAKYWHMAKLPFNSTFIPIYCDFVLTLINAIIGNSKKLLILDLDNTIWGGIIGDDGISGIKIGQGDALGEAYADFQARILELNQRGIVLAVCSKNEKNIAMSVFDGHPDMILKKEHFAAFSANWTDKATNIERIASRLNLGLSSVMFVDDNPAERMQVRNALPEVSVPEMPDDPAQYSQTLLGARYFEVIAVTHEDRLRAEYYSANLKRHELLVQKKNLKDHLTNLEMELEFRHFDEVGHDRIVQLINKTNQFNLTTLRMDSKKVEFIRNSKEYLTLQVRLVDRFGDNGMIAVVIGRQVKSQLVIENWLMSCRVFERRVEEATLRELIRLCKNRKITLIKGSYIPTDRNVIVQDLYKKLNFTAVSGLENNQTWQLIVESYRPKQLPFKVKNAL